jgi:hypothetical protein
VLRPAADDDRPSFRRYGVRASVESQTTFSYDDLNRVITTTSDQTTYNDNLLKSQKLYDGLRRTTETRTYEGGTNYIAVQQQYDALGRAYRLLRYLSVHYWSLLTGLSILIAPDIYVPVNGHRNHVADQQNYGP